MGGSIVREMRVTGGVLRGREIRVPKSGVRPTQDMVRHALFSILGARTVGCRFLDLFAGSGAVGIEAWSRGASFVCWVEKSRATSACLKGNVDLLCDGQGMVWGGDVLSFVKKSLVDEGFDIVFCDPPYGGEGRKDLVAPTLDGVGKSGLLKPGALVVVETEASGVPVSFAGWTAVDQRRYGGSCLHILVRTAEDGR